MAGFYINSGIGYYEGDRQGDDIEVPRRPDQFHFWKDGAWVTDQAAINADIWAQIRSMENRENLPRLVRDLAKKSAAEDAAKIGLTLDQVYVLAVAQGDAAPEAAKGWKKFKDFDDAIAALKRQLV